MDTPTTSQSREADAGPAERQTECLASRANNPSPSGTLLIVCHLPSPLPVHRAEVTVLHQFAADLLMDLLGP